MGSDWKILQIPARPKIHCLDRQQLILSLKYCQDITEEQLSVFDDTGCCRRGNSNGNADSISRLHVPFIPLFQHVLSRTDIPLSILQTLGLDPVQKIIKAVISLLPYFHPKLSRCWPCHQGVLEVLAAEEVSCPSRKKWNLRIPDISPKWHFLPLCSICCCSYQNLWRRKLHQGHFIKQLSLQYKTEILFPLNTELIGSECGCECCNMAKEPMPHSQAPISHLPASPVYLRIMTINFTLLEPSKDNYENVLIRVDMCF